MGRFLAFKHPVEIGVWVVAVSFCNNHGFLLDQIKKERCIVVEKSDLVGGGTIYATGEVQSWKVLDFGGFLTPVEQRGPIIECLMQHQRSIRQLRLST